MVVNLSSANTVKEARSVLSMGSYLRKFVEEYSSIVAPITDLLWDKRFASKRARKLLVPWGEEQDKALAALVRVLTSPPTVVLPDRESPFELHGRQ